MTLLQYCGLAALATVAVLLLRESNKNYTVIIVISFSVISLLLALQRTSTAVASILKIVRDSTLAVYAVTVLKAVGLAVLGEVTGDLCRSAGENNLAGGVEVCAKAEIMLSALPLISEILETAERLL